MCVCVCITYCSQCKQFKTNKRDDFLKNMLVC